MPDDVAAAAFDRFIESLPDRMRKVYEDHGHHVPTLFGLKAGKVEFISGIDGALLAPEAKAGLCLLLRAALRAQQCDGYALICESWLVQAKTARAAQALLAGDLPPSKHPERIDVITLYAARAGRRLIRTWEVDEQARRVIGEIDGMDTTTGGRVTGVFTTLLEPVSAP